MSVSSSQWFSCKIIKRSICFVFLACFLVQSSMNGHIFSTLQLIRLQFLHFSWLNWLCSCLGRVSLNKQAASNKCPLCKPCGVFFIKEFIKALSNSCLWHDSYYLWSYSPRSLKNHQGIYLCVCIFIYWT